MAAAGDRAASGLIRRLQRRGRSGCTRAPSGGSTPEHPVALFCARPQWCIDDAVLGIFVGTTSLKPFR
ncbi:MAG: hypothetical protein EBZ51_08610 [Synechococcaceae bacterium WB9_2_112]|nr:hypothetical protein [Synechococcaceae bacterium WB9_2_112]